MSSILVTNDSGLMRTIVPAIIVSMLIATVSFGQGNTQIPVLDTSEKAQIVESLLQLEKEAQVAEFESIRKLSSDNIEFYSAEQISKFGFSLLTAEQINRLKADNVIEYVRIKSINYVGKGVVMVKLLRVTEGRPCFSEPFSRQQSVTFEFTKNFENASAPWIGRLTGKSLPFSLGRGLTTKH